MVKGILIKEGNGDPSEGVSVETLRTTTGPWIAAILTL